uniref:Dienelactone hydrolase domain-containing protein n=1 Tax=Leptocylindrus danicus TaxID=163516 RepID=A0A7S2KCV6_9STRA|mmetsp:Transcript_20765/g.30941  ORF Transcript_20765/g.30941 Transcript_20765/m.30941 type:complete len:272 (+) Transcript_20765:110-925(+)
MGGMFSTNNNTNECCPANSWPVLPSTFDAAYEPKGEDITLLIESNNCPAYYVSATLPDANKAIVVFNDVYGPTNRSKSVCDSLATMTGYHVISPDNFRGETKDTAIADGTGVQKWLQKYPYDKVVGPDLAACIGYLTSKGVDPANIGAVGFCWGGWAIVRASATEGLLKCGVCPHPSTKIEKWAFSGSEDDIASNVSASTPIFLMPAGNDPDNVKPGGSVAEILKEKGGKCVVYEDMVHGWITRGDFTDVEVKKAADGALAAAVDFLKENM